MPVEDEEPQEIEDTPSEGKGSQPSPKADEGLTAAMAGWTEALRSIQKSIDEAAAAIRFLRETVGEMAPLLHSLGNLEDALRGFEGVQAQPQRTGEVEDAPSQEMGAGAVSVPPTAAGEEVSPEQAWETWRQRAPAKGKPTRWAEPEEEPALAPAGPPRAALKPITLVPEDSPAAYSYKVTVEDPGQPVELVPMHQALSAVPAIRNLSLLSYVNGVAAIFVEATEEVQPPDLESSIRKTLKRSCSVLPHDENTILIQVGNPGRSSGGASKP